MAICYYTCNLLPTALLAHHGHVPQRMADTSRARDPAAERQSHLCHSMTCPYVVRTLAAADDLLADNPSDCLVVPAGCDAMRRAGDVLTSRYPRQVRSLSLPRQVDERAAHRLAHDLEALEEWLAKRAPRSPAPTKPDPATLPAASIDYPAEPQPHGVFVVAGPLGNNDILRFIHDLGLPVSGLESCTGPERETLLKGPSGIPGTDDHQEGSNPLDAAGHILSEGICPRSSVRHRRDHLRRRLEECEPASVLYLRQPFCDPGAYDALTVSRLADELGVPFLELEIGFPGELSGPLRTRIEAFLETLTLDGGLL